MTLAFMRKRLVRTCKGIVLNKVRVNNDDIGGYRWNG